MRLNVVVYYQQNLLDIARIMRDFNEGLKASTCEYGNLVDELIRDRLVTGIINDNVRKQLLKEHELSLHKAVRICQLNELSEAHANSLADTSAAVLKKEVDALRMNTCSNCGFAHNDAPESCRAQGKLCNFCKRPGHFEAMCRIKKRQENTQPTIERESTRKLQLSWQRESDMARRQRCTTMARQARQTRICAQPTTNA